MWTTVFHTYIGTQVEGKVLISICKGLWWPWLIVVCKIGICNGELFPFSFYFWLLGIQHFISTGL